MSHRRTSTISRPSASTLASPLIRAWAPMVFQSSKRGCTFTSRVRSMNELGSRGRNSWERCRSPVTTRTMSPPTVLPPAALKAGMATGTGCGLALLMSITSCAFAAIGVMKASSPKATAIATHSLFKAIFVSSAATDGLRVEPCDKALPLIVGFTRQLEGRRLADRQLRPRLGRYDHAGGAVCPNRPGLPERAVLVQVHLHLRHHARCADGAAV